MARKPTYAPTQYLDLPFPARGVDVSRAYAGQPKLTTPLGVNVRTHEPSTDRARGGRRPGLSRFVNAKVNGTHPVQEVATCPYSVAPASATLTGRRTRLVAVAGGAVYVEDSGAWLAATVDSGAALSSTVPVIRSAVNSGALFFADGTNWTYYAPATNTVYTWAALAGTLPVDVGSNKPRLIGTWRGRTVLSGLPLDAANWFMSAVGNALDFDYAPAAPVATQAVAGNDAPAGKVPDSVTAIVPYSDDVLIFGGDHSIWAMNGDPMNGGRLDLVSDQVGMAWGQAWCKDPFGSIYFLGTRGGVYTLVPGQKPVRLSQPIDSLLADLDLSAVQATMCWDEGAQGFHLYLTKTASALAATHYFWEKRPGAWWVDEFEGDSMNPLVCGTYDGDDPGDRRSVLGSWDGYVRCWDNDAEDDDGEDVGSEVILGPLLTKDFDEIRMKELQGVLGEASGDVEWSVYVGGSAEEALNSAARDVGTFAAGKNHTAPARRSGHAIWVKLTSTDSWALERLRVAINGTGRVRRRA